MFEFKSPPGLNTKCNSFSSLYVATDKAAFVALMFLRVLLIVSNLW